MRQRDDGRRLADCQNHPSGDFALFHAGEDGVDVFQGLGFDVGFHQAVGSEGNGLIQVLTGSDI